jgi:hypothetical protein
MSPLDFTRLDAGMGPPILVKVVDLFDSPARYPHFCCGQTSSMMRFLPPNCTSRYDIQTVTEYCPLPILYSEYRLADW